MYTILFEASNSHISQETARKLEQKRLKYFVYDVLDTGFLIHLTDYEELQQGNLERNELNNLVESVLAKSPDCRFLLLDAIGITHDWLPTFDWEDIESGRDFFTDHAEE